MREILVVLLFAVSNVLGAKILAMLPSPLPSHRNALRGVLHTLSTHHSITYYGPSMSIKSANFTEKGIQIEQFQENISKQIFTQSCEIPPSHVIVMDYILWLNKKYFDDMFHGNDIKELMKSNKKYDLIITLGHACETFYQLAEKFNVPIILVSPSVPPVWANDQVGNPNFLSTDISFVSAESTDTFPNRLTKFIKHLMVSYHFNYRYIPMLNSVTKKYFPPETPPLEEAIKRIILIFSNTNSAMGYARANVPNIVEIGGLHCHPPKPLATDLEQFIQGAGDDGIIYMSFGGTIRASDMPEMVKRTFLNVFSKLKQRVLWKMEEDMGELPSNVRISKWYSQQDILGHKKVKLFITQGGMLSFQEASYHGVPVLVVPLIVDQYTNALLAEKNQYGKKLYLCELSEEKLMEDILELLRNPTYKGNAQIISQAMKDQDLHSSERVLFWTDFVMRNGKVPLLHSNMQKLSWFHLFHLDILIAFLLTLVSLILIIYYVIKYFVNLFATPNIKIKIS